MQVDVSLAQDTPGVSRLYSQTVLRQFGTFLETLGVRALAASTSMSGAMPRVSSSMELFDGVPKSVAAVARAVEPHVARLMLAAGATGMELTGFDESDLRSLEELWASNASAVVPEDEFAVRRPEGFADSMLEDD